MVLFVTMYSLYLQARLNFATANLFQDGSPGSLPP